MWSYKRSSSFFSSLGEKNKTFAFSSSLIAGITKSGTTRRFVRTVSAVNTKSRRYTTIRTSEPTNYLSNKCFLQRFPPPPPQKQGEIKLFFSSSTKQNTDTINKETEIIVFNDVVVDDNKAPPPSKGTKQQPSSKTTPLKSISPFGTPAARQAFWNQMLNELIIYQKKYGDCFVGLNAEEYPSLSRWVDTQRTQYHWYQQGRDDSQINPQRIKALEQIGFIWSIIDYKWEEKYKQMITYKETNGHCYVPRDHGELSNWVVKQRYEYKIVMNRSNNNKNGGDNDDNNNNYHHQSSVVLTQERIIKLEKIGFIWDQHEETWNLRFQELKEYKFTYGDCLVPKIHTTHPKLYTWVKKQREQYKKLMNGQPSHLTPRRLERLENMGFHWSKRDYLWYLMFEEMEHFYQINGHCDVPLRSDRRLRSWALRQHGHYENFVKGKKSSMTEERIAKLDSIHFFSSSKK